MIIRGRLVVEDGEKNIKNGMPAGEGTINVSLPRAPFRIEGDGTESVEFFNIPFGQGVRSANYSIARCN